MEKKENKKKKIGRQIAGWFMILLMLGSFVAMLIGYALSAK